MRTKILREIKKIISRSDERERLVNEGYFFLRANLTHPIYMWTPTPLLLNLRTSPLSMDRERKFLET